MFNKQIQKLNIFTRKLKNKFKTTRKKRKVKNNKMRIPGNTSQSVSEIKKKIRRDQAPSVKERTDAAIAKYR